MGHIERIKVSKLNLEIILNCVICSKYMSDPTTMKCGHSFCRQCILKWLCAYKHTGCPLCRKKVSKNVPDVNISLKQLIVSIRESRNDLEQSSKKALEATKDLRKKTNSYGIGTKIGDSTLSRFIQLTNPFHIIFSFFGVCLVLLIKMFKLW